MLKKWRNPSSVRQSKQSFLYFGGVGWGVLVMYRVSLEGIQKFTYDSVDIQRINISWSSVTIRKQYSITRRILLFSFLTVVLIYCLIIAYHFAYYKQSIVCSISDLTEIKKKMLKIAKLNPLLVTVIRPPWKP